MVVRAETTDFKRDLEVESHQARGRDISNNIQVEITASLRVSQIGVVSRLAIMGFYNKIYPIGFSILAISILPNLAKTVNLLANAIHCSLFSAHNNHNGNSLELP